MEVAIGKPLEKVTADELRGVFLQAEKELDERGVERPYFIAVTPRIGERVRTILEGFSRPMPDGELPEEESVEVPPGYWLVGTIAGNGGPLYVLASDGSCKVPELDPRARP